MIELIDCVDNIKSEFEMPFVIVHLPKSYVFAPLMYINNPVC